MIEFLFSTARSIGGGLTTFAGAYGADSVVKVEGATTSGIGGKTTSILGGAGIFFL